jgi:F-type H+-transporting ATPase subunit epsilon
MSFNLVIISPQKKIFEGKVDSVNVPGEEGRLEILSHHAPLLAALTKGKIETTKGGAKESFEISKGFIEASQNNARVLVR